MVLVPVRRSFLGLAAMVAACLWSASAEADIVSTTGDIDVLSSPPTSVTMSGKGILVSDSYIYTFAEQTNLRLTSSVKVDITSAGTYNSPSSLPTAPISIAAGTMVDSYLLDTNPSNNNQVFTGSVTFSASTPILGIMVLSSTLSASDTLLGAPGTKYPTGDSDRGLELNKNQDYLTLTVLSDGETKITVHFYTHGNVDQIRILTAVPEPSSLVIAACGATLLAAGPLLRRRGRLA